MKIDRNNITATEAELLAGDWQELVERRHRTTTTGPRHVFRVFRWTLPDGPRLICCETECIGFSLSSLRFGRVSTLVQLRALDSYRLTRDDADGGRTYFDDEFARRLYGKLATPLSEEDIEAAKLER